MQTLIQPVILRFLTYVLSPLALMLPAWAAGLVVVDQAHGLVSLSLTTACSLIAAAIVANLGIASRWGVKVDEKAVGALLARLAGYGAAPAIAALPSSWAGLVTYSAASGMISLSYAGLASVAAVAIGGSAGVFAKWGAKP